MAVDLQGDLPGEPARSRGGVAGAVGNVVVPVAVHRRRGLLLLGLGAFQLWLWGTRIVNLLGDTGEFSAAFIGVHLVLYTAAIGAGVLLGVLGFRQWREAARVGRP